jgi:hypothetical protein
MDIEEKLADLEERVGRLEKARKRDDQLTKSAAGQLRRIAEAQNLEEVKKLLLIFAGQMDPKGGGG